MALGIFRHVRAVAPEHVLGLCQNLRPGRARARVVVIHVVDVDVEALGHAAVQRLRASPLVLVRGRAHHDHAVFDVHFGVHDVSVRSGHRYPEMEAEALGQPIERGGGVVVEDIRSDPWHAVGGRCRGHRGSSRRAVCARAGYHAVTQAPEAG